MTKTTTNLLLMLITIIAGTYFYITYCSTCGSLGNSEPEPTPQAAVKSPPKASSFPFALSAGDFSFSTNDNYNFEPSAYAILTPLSDKVLEGAAALKGYFDTAPNGRVNITGYYTAEEDNPSAYPNLGLARANAVKNHLISKHLLCTDQYQRGITGTRSRSGNLPWSGRLQYGNGQRSKRGRPRCLISSDHTRPFGALFQHRGRLYFLGYGAT